MPPLACNAQSHNVTIEPYLLPVRSLGYSNPMCDSRPREYRKGCPIHYKSPLAVVRVASDREATIIVRRPDTCRDQTRHATKTITRPDRGSRQREVFEAHG